CYFLMPNRTISLKFNLDAFDALIDKIIT
ncbi:MAG: hypothetical protein RLZZ119_819, partial [Pseudomonadota bacterium]